MPTLWPPGKSPNPTSPFPVTLVKQLAGTPYAQTKPHSTSLLGAISQVIPGLIKTAMNPASLLPDSVPDSVKGVAKFAENPGIETLKYLLKNGAGGDKLANGATGGAVAPAEIQMPFLDLSQYTGVPPVSNTTTTPTTPTPTTNPSESITGLGFNPLALQLFYNQYAVPLMEKMNNDQQALATSTYNDLAKSLPPGLRADGLSELRDSAIAASKDNINAENSKFVMDQLTNQIANAQNVYSTSAKKTLTNLLDDKTFKDNLMKSLPQEYQQLSSSALADLLIQYGLGGLSGAVNTITGATNNTGSAVDTTNDPVVTNKYTPPV